MPGEHRLHVDRLCPLYSELASQMLCIMQNITSYARDRHSSNTTKVSVKIAVLALRNLVCLPTMALVVLNEPRKCLVMNRY